ncbi:IS66 family insertion sequence element accessory protein TnpB [Prevotella sp. S7-1-8]|uniref:IS66 family insertion sequence element accessory protein TnpB n=1 Tax=Prevotella sp. S7-1-8 TaxID=1284775 RepID=UPI0012E067A8|nr:IS66 family insertion sequence element accessory protein TnpB [Prevotella sp. S7-1-8]
MLRLSKLARGYDFNPFDGVVYVFCIRSLNRIKLFHWERRGFVVYHKRMAQGCMSQKIIRQNSVPCELRLKE